MSTRTVGQACRELGVSWHTLSLWCKKLGIEATHHPLDLRLWLLQEEDIERIRTARETLPRLTPKDVPPARVRPPQPGSDARHATDDALDLPSATPSDLPLSASEGQVEHITPRRPYAPFAQRPRLPDGWVSFNAWCAEHGVNHRAVQREIAAGRMPAPERGEWWERPQGPTLSAYTSEQHMAAAAFAKSRWPERFTPCETCPPVLPEAGTTEGRQFTPTVPMPISLPARSSSEGEE